LSKSKLLKEDALSIAKKLKAFIEPEGPHQNATFYYNGLFILEFGIRHGKNSGHGHLVGENGPLRLNETKAVSFARCHISLEEYVEILIQKGVIPSD
jgi:hypothetical protein